MTSTDAQQTWPDCTVTPAAAPWQPLSELELALRQLGAIERWHDVRHAVELAGIPRSSQETGGDLARRLATVRQRHRRIVARTQTQWESTGWPLAGTAACRVLLVHRSAWFLERIDRVLCDHGLTVVAQHDDVADALGDVVAEQPDLLLVEDGLAGAPGDHLVDEALSACPHARVVAQVAEASRVGALLDAGASAVFTRRVPPVDVALAMCRLVGVTR